VESCCASRTSHLQSGRKEEVQKVADVRRRIRPTQNAKANTAAESNRKAVTITRTARP